MKEELQKIIEKLVLNNKTISTMESCTGGALANEITNIPGSSEILKFSAVTYSNEYKIKMGVDKNIIDKYSVYSIETAKEMSKKISNFTDSDYGIGITGKLNRHDSNNKSGKDNEVFVSIYNKENDTYNTMTLEVLEDSREKNKMFVLQKIIFLLGKLI